ncbi:unnamed protein product, partial [Iphiclides podalirius]
MKTLAARHPVTLPFYFFYYFYNTSEARGREHVVRSRSPVAPRQSGSGLPREVRSLLARERSPRCRDLVRWRAVNQLSGRDVTRASISARALARRHSLAELRARRARTPPWTAVDRSVKHNYYSDTDYLSVTRCRKTSSPRWAPSPELSHFDSTIYGIHQILLRTGGDGPWTALLHT